MTTVAQAETIKTLTTHYIDGAFVESHGREVIDIMKPTNGKVIARVTLGDEEDTRRAIASAKRGSQGSAGQRKKSARFICADYTRPSQHASMI
jgi:acyl-CoA reductase-like NAD-dependent aldehyde dehydrogenase